MTNNIGIYCRCRNYDANTIKRNLSICERFLHDNYDDVEILYYIDINRNSSSAYRPAFERLKEDIKKKKIDLCVTSSISQISRRSIDIYNLKDIILNNNKDFDIYCVKENCFLFKDLTFMFPLEIINNDNKNMEL